MRAKGLRMRQYVVRNAMLILAAISLFVGGTAFGWIGHEQQRRVEFGSPAYASASSVASPCVSR